MKTILSITAALIASCSLTSTAQGHPDKHDNSLFTTSVSLDMIASLQNFDQIKDAAQFTSLASDTAFTEQLMRINENARASNLCNFYSKFHGDKNNTDSCVTFFMNIPDNDSIIHSDEKWIKNIAGLQHELAYCISALNQAGYSSYWEKEVKPLLDRYINSYPVSEETLNVIHEAMTEFSGPEILPPTHSSTYVMNIDNAFNLYDESLCCTPLLLDPELEKKFRLDFIKVYIHENLHRLSISEELMKRLKEIEADEFYREHENIARQHNEGGNEAFVVASEAFISHKIRLRDDQSVYNEFKEYVDGSLVLAPIIYVNLPDKKAIESLNDFIIRLFDQGKIKTGSIRQQYENAMNQLMSKIQ